MEYFTSREFSLKHNPGGGGSVEGWLNEASFTLKLKKKPIVQYDRKLKRVKLLVPENLKATEPGMLERVYNNFFAKAEMPHRVRMGENGGFWTVENGDAFRVLDGEIALKPSAKLAELFP